MMGVKIKHWKGAWWLFVNNQGRRKAKRVGVGNAGKKAAKEVATKLAARLALGEFKMDDAPVPTFQVYAERWLQQLAMWAAAGMLPGAVLNGCVRGIEIWIRVKEAEASFEAVEALRADVRALREERDRLARDLELAKAGIR